MPVAAVDATSTGAASSGPGAPATGATSPHPAPGFDAALATRMSDPRLLPTVSLDRMVASFVDQHAGQRVGPAGGLGAGLAGTATLGAAAGAGAGVRAGTATAVGDAWGAAAARPSSIDGPGAMVLAAGERYLGVPYRWGGTDAATGFDCSGFVQQVYADLGVSLPRVSIDQSKAGVAVDGMADARPGDLVFWNGDGSRPNHIGIYAGEGRMLVAPRTGDVVRYQEITRTPDAVRRVIG